MLVCGDGEGLEAFGGFDWGFWGEAADGAVGDQLAAIVYADCAWFFDDTNYDTVCEFHCCLSSGCRL